MHDQFERRFCRALFNSHGLIRPSYFLSWVWLLVVLLLAGCASSGDNRGPVAFSEPRPLGVAEEVNPDDRGREVLRVVIELIRHGNLRDTEFASKLFKLPIKRDGGLTVLGNGAFPQQLITLFRYELARPSVNASIRDHVSMSFDSGRVCVRREDFLEYFWKEFGVGKEIVSAKPTVPALIVSRDLGWSEAQEFHLTGSRSIQQGMPNGIVVSGLLPKNSGCVSHIGLDQYRPL